MPIYRISSTLFIIGVTMMGCTTVPEKHATLEQAISNFSAAQNDPAVTKHAALELEQADHALKSAVNAWSNKDDAKLVDHLAYLAKQRALIAHDTGRLRSAELAVASAGTRRDAVLLEMRTAEADASRRQVTIAHDAADRQAEKTATAAAQSAAELKAATRRIEEIEKELADLNAMKTDRGLVITLGDVLFDFDKAEIKPGSERNLQKVADFLNKYPNRKALVEGFTDNTGNATYNQILSERRAEAVRMFLINNGISSERIAARGYGKLYPVASNDNPVTRQLNRRVEIVVSDGDNYIDPR